MRAAALLLLATGCRDLLEIEEAVSAELSYREAGTGGIVAGGMASGGFSREQSFELRFAAGDGFHFPDSLRVGDVNLLGHDPGQGCDEEDESGIRISPSSRIGAHGGATPVRNQLTPVMRGPAVAQVKLEWSTRLPCNSDRNPGGTSTFTVFIDGRIVRFDELADPSSAPLSASQCACGGLGSSFTVSTFWTFARESFGALTHSGLPDASLPLPAAGEVIANTGTQCLRGEREVGLAWHQSAGTAVRGHDKLISVGFDFQRASSTLPAFSYQNSSALFVGYSGCEAARDHVDPSMLTVNGVAVAPSERDGIYGGDRGPGGGPGIELENDYAELTGPVSTSYAVWLRFPSSVSSLRPRLAGAGFGWYVAQRVDDRSWVVWFRYPLQTGHTITITPG